MIDNNFRFHFRLDTRRALKGGKFPIQLFLYSKIEKQDIFYTLSYTHYYVYVRRYYVGSSRGSTKMSFIAHHSGCVAAYTTARPISAGSNTLAPLGSPYILIPS